MVLPRNKPKTKWYRTVKNKLKKKNRTEIYRANTERAKIKKNSFQCTKFKALQETKSFILQRSIVSNADVIRLRGPGRHITCLIPSERHPQITEVPLKGWFTVESLKVTGNIISRSQGLRKAWIQLDMWEKTPLTVMNEIAEWRQGG